ncbi:Uncharacterized protein HZ326_13177 [Fusarium oxysporum f. sp. albedinis]|nr:Uncharacterized protein HZ326_13177 [Fusarium oxysporum f. sp. albedinis]
MDDEEMILEGGGALEGEIPEEDEILEEVEIVDWKKAKSRNRNAQPGVLDVNYYDSLSQTIGRVVDPSYSHCQR